MLKFINSLKKNKLSNFSRRKYQLIMIKILNKKSTL